MGRGISRWDRPPPRKDVRWFVRLVGKTLIVIGLLMFGFVAYQLWGTGIEYARAQNQAEREFDELMAQASTTAPSTAPATTEGTATTEPATTEPAAAEPATAEPATTEAPPSTAAPTMTAPTTTTVLPTTIPVFDIASLEITSGKAFARLEVPSAGIDDLLVAGVERDDLEKGPGHYPQTPMPGQLGNSAIAGHRTTFGQPFFDVDKIEPGDDLIVTTPYGRFVYVATETVIVDPSEWEVIATTDPTVAALTLTSCHPKWSVSQRIVVHADLDLTRSDAPGQPVFNYAQSGGPDPGATLPGEPSATTSPAPETTAEPEPTGVATTEVATIDVATSVAITTEPTTPAGFHPDSELDSVVPGPGAIGGPGDGDEQAADAFGNTWFDDSAAWPQIALWGAAVAAIAVGGYRLAKAFRNSLIGVGAAVVPFLVTLYFFYQNVNRLLPTAL